MKLSDITKDSARLNEITALRDHRRECSDTIETVEADDCEVGDGYHSVTVSSPAAKQLIVAGLRQQISDIEAELTQMGIEIDEPANIEDSDDDESEDIEEAA